MLRVLLVEDNRVYRETFKENLRKHFPSVVIDEAGSSEEALQKIDIAPPHLAFIDIRLPGMNGFEATKRIKAAFPQIRIAMVTGYDLPEYRQAATQYGLDGFFIKKSLNWDEVERLIKSISLAETRKK